MAIVKFIIRHIIKISVFLSGIILGIFISVGIYFRSGITFEKQSAYDIFQFSYYVFGILGAIATMFAVIVALFKEEIIKRIYKPTLKVTLCDEGGLYENINRTNGNELNNEVGSYICFVKIENISNVLARQCYVKVCGCKYFQDGSKKANEKRMAQNNLKYENQPFDLRYGYPVQIKLFEIKNPKIMGTPQNNDYTPTIWFNGVRLSNEKRRKGRWIIEYLISVENGPAQALSLIVDWNGKFCSRAKSEMLNEISVELKTK